jgi:hypothetical protein
MAFRIILNVSDATFNATSSRSSSSLQDILEVSVLDSSSFVRTGTCRALHLVISNSCAKSSTSKNSNRTTHSLRLVS